MVSPDHPPLILGTRGSALALAQVDLTRRALADADPGLPCRVEIIKTTGDRRQDLRLTAVSAGGHGYDAPGGERVDPGLFTKELEAALLRGEIDVAVHSLKDLPTFLPEGLTLAAVLPRADPADVLVARLPAGPAAAAAAVAGGAAPDPLPLLPPGGLVATSSLRRQYQLRHLRPDLRTGDIRGNVDSRLAQLEQRPELSGIVLARAGLERLGHGADLAKGVLRLPDGRRLAAAVLGPELMLPAVGQGAIGLQVRTGDPRAVRVAELLNHGPTWEAVRLERALLARLGGGCQLPLGVTVTRLGPAELRLRAIYFPDADAPPRQADVAGPAADPAGLAERAAARLRS